MTETHEIQSFDGTRLVLDIEGAGPAVVLLHGFLVDGNLNWRANGFVDAIVDAGFTAIVPDARGHGRSERPHEPTRYANGALELDVLAIFDHLNHDDAAIVGYSMGADTAARVAARRPPRCLVLGGVGGDLSDPDDLNPLATADAVRAGDTGHPDPIVALASSLGADPLAAAALIEGLGRQPSPPFSSVRCPVLVAAGSDDDMAGGSPEALARRYPHGAALTIPGADHLTAVFDAGFLAATIDFLVRPARVYSNPIGPEAGGREGP